MSRAWALVVVSGVVAAGCTSTGDQIDGETQESRPAVEQFVGNIWTTTSPDGELELDIAMFEGGSLGHRLTDRGDVIVSESLIGLETSHGTLNSGLVVESVGNDEPWSDSFDLPTGKARSSAIDGTSRTIRFGHPDTPLDLLLDVVVTDHGAAWRTTLVADDAIAEAGAPTEATVTFERASFVFSETSTVWMQPHDRVSDFSPAYERIHGSGRDITTPVSSAQGWNFPVLTRHDYGWMLLTEAGLTPGWAGSHIASTSADGELFLAFPNELEGNGLGESEPSGALPFTSPWRVMLASTDLGDMVESSLVRHLSEPDDGRDWSWVEPGRVSWSWWSEPSSPTDPDRLIDFVDLAAELDWEYSLVDANWNFMEPADLQRVIDHADAADVGLMLWYNSGGPNNIVTEAPRDLMFDRDVRRGEMERIAALGIRGIKVDFFQSDKPVVIEQYLDILADAADFELLVNFHGSTLPRGWERTWPNLMTMESVAGGEQYLFNPSYPTIAPPQNVVLAFTRNVVGPMDYTPGAINDSMARRTTDVHEVALAVVYESALTHFIDTPEAYLGDRTVLTSVLSAVPTVWDEIKLLDGHPDSHVAVARRHGDDWWVGVINGRAEPVEVDLSGVASLAGIGQVVVMICDDEERKLTPGEIGTVELPAFGGCIITP